MAQPLRVVAAALVRLLAGIAVWAGVLLVTASSPTSSSARALVMLAFAALGAGIFACGRVLLRGRAERRTPRRSRQLRVSEFFRAPSGLLSGSRRSIDS